MFKLESLPYAEQALEPYISARTISFHYKQHHQAYLNKFNKYLIGSPLENDSLEQIIIKSFGNSQQLGIFNNGAQYYNHNFFWSGLIPASKKLEPDSKLIKLLEKNFGSLDGFYKKFKEVALSLFGSGWVWLVQNEDSLKIIKTSNADNPLIHNLKALWVLDVWEHAYYLDYQNKRGDFIDAILRNLINWKFINDNLKK